MQQDKWADWISGSGWTKKRTPLTDEQLAALAEYKLHDLTKRLPDRPSDEAYELLTEMMEISIQRQVTGENGVWNPEWEAAGFKPLRQRGDEKQTVKAESDDGDDDSSTKSSGKGTGTLSSLDRLKAARGKGTEAPEAEAEEELKDDSPADVAAAAEVEVEVPAEAGKTSVSDLAAKIEARVGKKTA